ncbi:MAG: hypothetical protein QOJ27_305 [Sphingomonadales bacterium]|nr:hypothetical protein [Sphingomonadales bacterium]
MIRSILAVLMLMLGSACTQLPKVELQAYSEAFAASRTAAEPLLESYTVREREETVKALRASGTFKTTGFYDEFEPQQAALVSSLSLPPGAEASRRAFDAIARYNDTLVALAGNRNIDEAQAQVKQITADLDAVKSNLPFIGNIPGVDQLGTAASTLLNLFQPIIQEDNREQFKNVVVAGYPAIKELIAALRDLTKNQYSLITKPLRDQWDVANGDAQAQAKIAEQINGWHTVFADYVVMLNIMDQRLNDLQEAVNNPKKEPLLARAVAGAADVRAYSDILRRSIAALHTPK